LIDTAISVECVEGFGCFVDLKHYLMLLIIEQNSRSTSPTVSLYVCCFSTGAADIEDSRLRSANTLVDLIFSANHLHHNKVEVHV